MIDMSRVGRWTRTAWSNPCAMDLAIAATLTGAALVDNAVRRMAAGDPVTGVAIVAAVIVGYGGLLCRRRWPAAALVVTVAAAEVYISASSLHWWILPAPLLALYHLGVTSGDRRRLLAAGGLAALVLGGVPTLVTSAAGWEPAWLREPDLSVAAACGLALAAGDGTRSRRAYLAEVEERARRAEHNREQEARRRVTEERLRIARELHDSLGHHIALINAQAGMAEHVFRDQPATALAGLSHIRHASRSALDDLRKTVGLLRQPGEPTLATEPAVGVSGISALVASFRRSGMPVKHELGGRIRPLPPAADLTAYRVVQESLTNIRKHADGAAARVHLSFRPEALHITVENEECAGSSKPAADPSRTVPNGDRHGIVGMRERVSAVGGSLDAGTRPGGGFRVRAVLPLAGGGPA